MEKGGKIRQRKYVKSILGLDKRTPNYSVMEEMKMSELSRDAVKKVRNYEESARNSKKKIVLECLRELDKEKERNDRRKKVGKEKAGDNRSGVKEEELKKWREREEPKGMTQRVMDKSGW